MYGDVCMISDVVCESVCAHELLRVMFILRMYYVGCTFSQISFVHNFMNNFNLFLYMLCKVL